MEEETVERTFSNPTFILIRLEVEWYILLLVQTSRIQFLALDRNSHRSEICVTLTAHFFFYFKIILKRRDLILTVDGIGQMLLYVLIW